MQLKTRIIVDSTADLVPEIKERVHTVPLTVHFGQEVYRWRDHRPQDLL